MSSALDLTVASHSHIGRRGNNEDAVYATVRDAEESKLACVAVADGMGGHAAGEEASRIAVERIAQLVRVGYDPGDDPILVFTQVYREINRRIAGYADEHPEAAGLGTTLVTAVAHDDVAYIFNVGDSRAYWFPESGAIEQVTQDHSAAAEAVRNGEMTVEEAKHHPYAHALTHCLDGDGNGEPDYFKLELGEPGFLLLCSDGLTGALSDDEISRVLFGTSAIDGPEGAAQQLTALAHQRGGRRQDNTSVALLEVGEVERDTLITAVAPAPEPAEATASPGLPRRKRVAAIVSALLFTALLFVGAYAWMGGATLPQNAVVGDEDGSGRVADVSADDDAQDNNAQDNNAQDNNAQDNNAQDNNAQDNNAQDNNGFSAFISDCDSSAQDSTVELRYNFAEISEEPSVDKVVVIQRTLDAENRYEHAWENNRFQPKRGDAPFALPGADDPEAHIGGADHCVYSRDAATVVPHSYANGIAYFYLMYALDTEKRVWVSVNEGHGKTPYSWDTVEKGEMTLREATDDEGAENVREFIRRIYEEDSW
jgi:protein phosphatase